MGQRQYSLLLQCLDSLLRAQVRWNDGHQSLYPYARFVDEYTYATYDEYGRADNEDDDQKQRGHAVQRQGQSEKEEDAEKERVNHSPSCGQPRASAVGRARQRREGASGCQSGNIEEAATRR